MGIRKHHTDTFAVSLTPLVVKATLLSYLTAQQTSAIHRRLTRGALQGVVFLDRFQVQRQKPWWLREQPPQYEGTIIPTASGASIHVVAHGYDDRLLITGILSVLVLLVYGFAFVNRTAIPWGISVFVCFSVILALIDHFSFIREVHDDIAELHAVLVQATRVDHGQVDVAPMQADLSGEHTP